MNLLVWGVLVCFRTLMYFERQAENEAAHQTSFTPMELATAKSPTGFHTGL